MDKPKLIKTLKKAGIISLWIVLSMGLIFSLAFVNKENSNLACASVTVNIDPENELRFINREMVITIINPTGDENKIKGQKIKSLKIPNLENRIESNKFIKNAQVFTDMNGILHINIDQKIPILRIINVQGQSFYLDKDGNKIPESPVFTAHVPVATGNIFEGIGDTSLVESFVGTELYKIATYVDKDAFWKAQIEQIFVNAESELVLIPKVGEHTIHFGSSVDMEQKFKKLMLFYKEALSRIGWDKYSDIDLRFINQIVCKKNLNN